MKTILAHLKKDIASFRPLLLIWAIFVGVDCLAFLDRIPLPHGSAPIAGVVILVGVALFVASGVASLVFQMLVLPFLIVRVMHTDPLTESDAFWRTRPISRRALLTEKALFILLLLAEAVLAASATRFHAENTSRTATLLQAAAFVSGLMAFTSVTSSFSKLILNFIGIALGAGMLASMVLGFGHYVESIGPNLFHIPVSVHSLYSSNPGHVGTSVLMLGGYLIVVIYQYLTLKTNISRMGLFTILFLAALLQGG